MAKSKARMQVCFLLDETQSMLARKKETIQGFNGYLEDLKKDKGDEVLFTFTLFNKDNIRTLHKAEPVKNVKALDDKTYQPQNWTPLYDAIGTTICAIKDSVKKNDLVIFVILTDGEENSSKEYKLQDVKDLVGKHEKEGWKFVFLGVGIDAFSGSSQIGISQASAFNVGGNNTATMYSTLSNATMSYRSSNMQVGAKATQMQDFLSAKDRKDLQG